MAITIKTRAGDHELDIDVNLIERIEERTGEPIFAAIESAFGISLSGGVSNLEATKVSVTRTRGFMAGAMGCEPEELNTVFTPQQYIAGSIALLSGILGAFAADPQTPGDPAPSEPAGPGPVSSSG